MLAEVGRATEALLMKVYQAIGETVRVKQGSLIRRR
jgi:hypothetical protein